MAATLPRGMPARRTALTGPVRALWRLCRPAFTPAAGGALLTAAQLVLACLLSGQPTWGLAYQSLCQWDSRWYSSIATDGYVCPEVWAPQEYGNVAFFPGYPAWAWAVGRVLAVPVTTALLVSAALAAWGFWTLLLLCLWRAQVPARVALPAVLFLFTDPGAFFLVAGYSESLFLCGLLGYVYLCDSGRGRGLAVVPGVVMTGTRLVGLPLVIYPVVGAWLQSTRGRNPLRALLDPRLAIPLAVAALAALGTLGFFAYCHVCFGEWDLYFRTEKFGWAVEPNYFALFCYDTYLINPLIRVRDGFLEPDWLGKASVPVLGLIWLGLVWAERQAARSGRATDWQGRAGLYACAFLMYFVNVSGRHQLGMCGMLRYAFPIYVLLVLAAAQLVSRVGLPQDRRTRSWLLRGFVAAIVFRMICQAVYMHKFTHSVWVA